MKVCRIFYDDGTVHEGAATEEWWESLPRHGVIIVKETERAPNDLVHMGMDYYWLEDGEVKSCNRADLDRYLERARGLRCVKFGRWAADTLWQAAHDDAMGAG